ncbi:MAG: 30S ribosomal protein S2 [Candidatus Latescibacteria bacterium]|nr:30S ribosomal protein S2 [Candidatus Latescibacterota bacterium]
MAEVSIKELLEAGVHFGHQTRRWNPKMKKYIFTERNNIYIIDLQKTQKLLTNACEKIRDIAAKGQAVLFVGTKPQAAAIIKEEAERCNQFYVTNRWLGGMLTNYRTIRQSIKRLEHLEKISTDGTYEHFTKKEILTHEKNRQRLSQVLDGIRNMNRIPGLLIVVDTKKEKIAVSEARRLGIPVCAILDTNSDPDPITFPIPGNDDAIRSIQLLISNITDSILEGAQMIVDEGILAEKEKLQDEADLDDEQKQKRRHPSHKPLIVSDDEDLEETDVAEDSKDTKKLPRKRLKDEEEALQKRKARNQLKQKKPRQKSESDNIAVHPAKKTDMGNNSESKGVED